MVSPAGEDWEEERGLLLTLRTPELGKFSGIAGKTLYRACVKVRHKTSLATVRETKWSVVFGTGFSPKGCWRSLYKPPIDKRSGDLQWRILHGAIATNRYLAHVDPSTGGAALSAIGLRHWSIFFSSVPG